MKTIIKKIAPAHTLKSAQDALMAAAILAMAADARLGKEELSRLDMLAAMNPLFTNIGNIREYAAKLAARLVLKPSEETLRDMREILPPRLRETAYAWAAYMVAADRKVLHSEHEFLSSLRKALSIPGPLAGKINAVTAIVTRP